MEAYDSSLNYSSPLHRDEEGRMRTYYITIDVGRNDPRGQDSIAHTNHARYNILKVFSDRHRFVRH